jgi:hypothetical protein
MQHARHQRLVDPVQRAIRQRDGGRHSHRLAGKAALAEELAGVNGATIASLPSFDATASFTLPDLR